MDFSIKMSIIDTKLENFHSNNGVMLTLEGFKIMKLSHDLLCVDSPNGNVRF